MIVLEYDNYKNIVNVLMNWDFLMTFSGRGKRDVPKSSGRGKRDVPKSQK